MTFDYKKTTYACFTGYIVQAIVNSFVPLLFVTVQKSYHIPIEQITLLITVNFMIQLLIDMLSAGFIDRIGYRASVIIAHICAALGLALLTVLPELCANHFVGILIAVCIYAVGGGLIEVLISPIIEALSHRQQGGSDEPFTFVLLLGMYGSCAYIYALFYDIWDRALEGAYAFLDNYSNRKHDTFHKGSDIQPHG